MSKKVFRPENYPGAVIMKIGVCRQTEFEIVRNYLRMINKGRDIDFNDDNFNENYAYICFNFNNIGNYCVNHYKEAGFEVIYYDEFDWDLTFLAYYDNELDKINAKLIANSGEEMDLRMEKQKVIGQKELLEAKIEIESNNPPKLEVGQVVELRNGEMKFVLPDRLIGMGGWLALKKYNKNLESTWDSAQNLDIMKIYNAPINRYAAWNFNCSSKDSLELVWEREEEANVKN